MYADRLGRITQTFENVLKQFFFFFNYVHIHTAFVKIQIRNDDRRFFKFDSSRDLRSPEGLRF